jgi:L-alanine-DL-glutamate epimerase-like enolase superfamily enzyme
MIRQAVRITAQPLRLKLKTVVRHAAATRHTGESIWVKAERNGITGYGEGCPRIYVAGDDLESSIQWIHDVFSAKQVVSDTFEDMTKWIEENTALIDQYPSAWCAIETALLDLFSRERQCSVDALLGIDNPRRAGRYSAVLGDDNKSKFADFLYQYLRLGISDFKIKVSGNLEDDKERFIVFAEAIRQQGVPNVRVRLDANNLWTGNPDKAIDYLEVLDYPAFAIEEPVGVRNTQDISKVSLAMRLPIILDESLCAFKDINKFKDLPGKYIANIKVSRVGGILRALKLIREIQDLDWPIIIGCHVGETSLLTRAALIPAFAAGENLIAQEGAFGDYLVEKEPADPVLKFGRNGILDLNRSYYVETVQGLRSIPVENWELGFGMQCRMLQPSDDGLP